MNEDASIIYAMLALALGIALSVFVYFKSRVYRAGHAPYRRGALLRILKDNVMERKNHKKHILVDSSSDLPIDARIKLVELQENQEKPLSSLYIIIVHILIIAIMAVSIFVFGIFT